MNNLSAVAAPGKRIRYFFLLALFAIILFLPAIGEKRLWRTDEPRVAGISAEMARTHDYVMPKLNGKPFLEYPPMYYWVTSGFFTAFGRSAFTARLASGLAAIGAVLLLYLLMLKMGFKPLTGFLSGVVLGTTGQFWAIANRCLVDMTLCFFIVCAMVSFYCMHSDFVRKKKGFFINLLLFIGFVLSLAFGILTKSLVGLAIPACGLFFWLIAENIWNKKLYIKSWTVLITGSILSLMPAGIWVWNLYLRYGYETAYGTVWKNTVGRFIGSYAEHVNPFYYYFGKLPEQFLPWTVILVLIIIVLIKRRELFKLDFNLRFILCWFVFPFLMLCVSSGKRPVYLLPLYPALALFVSVMAMNIIEESYFLAKFNWNKIIMRLSALLLIIFVIVAIMIAVLFNHKNSFYPIFKYYQSIDNHSKRLYLYKPDEVMRGAVNFYLNKETPVINNASELKQVLNNKNNYAIVEHGSPDNSINQIKAFKIKGNKWFILNQAGNK